MRHGTVASICAAVLGFAVHCFAEDAPPDIRFLATAPTIQQLTARAHADLTWVEDDGTPLFVWIERSADARVRAISIDCAHRVRQDGRTFWAFVDAGSANGLPFSSPPAQYLLLKFCRARVVIGATPPDGNASRAERVSAARDGSEVYKVVYCSLSGDRANQEESRTFVLYIPLRGKPRLAAHDIGQEGTSSCGWVGEERSIEVTVLWTNGDPAVPFRARIREVRRQFPRLEQENPPEPLTVYRDGGLDGPFPARVTWDKTRYAIADGTTSLETVARLLAAYNSDPVKRDAAKRLWLSELRKQNHGLPSDQPLKKGTRITLPDEPQASLAIFESLRRSAH